MGARAVRLPDRRISNCPWSKHVLSGILQPAEMRLRGQEKVSVPPAWATESPRDLAPEFSRRESCSEIPEESHFSLFSSSLTTINTIFKNEAYFLKNRILSSFILKWDESLHTV